MLLIHPIGLRSSETKDYCGSHNTKYTQECVITATIFANLDTFSPSDDILAAGKDGSCAASKLALNNERARRARHMHNGQLPYFKILSYGGGPGAARVAPNNLYEP